MRYAIFGALILSLELLGASIPASAMSANGNATLKADLPRDVIQVYAGCGAKYKPNKQTGKCEPY
jgi:hypothetical protein